jgi:vacuolar-type H+-ATPase subunit F/Vma7
MGIRLLGNRQDAIAFGLAGLDAVECRTRADLIAALDDVRGDPHVALVVVAPAAAALGADLVEEMREATHVPITVVLPQHHLEADGPPAA